MSWYLAGSLVVVAGTSVSLSVDVLGLVAGSILIVAWRLGALAFSSPGGLSGPFHYRLGWEQPSRLASERGNAPSTLAESFAHPQGSHVQNRQLPLHTVKHGRETNQAKLAENTGSATSCGLAAIGVPPFHEGGRTAVRYCALAWRVLPGWTGTLAVGMAAAAWPGCCGGWAGCLRLESPLPVQGSIVDREQ